jgi:Skp family chaperone for outer membrane proteins
MKPAFVALLLTLALAPAALFAVQSRPSAPPVGNIAVVSIQPQLGEAAAAKASGKQLADLQKAKNEEVAGKKKALDETRLALANAGGLFAASKRAELKTTGQRQEAELKQATENAQKSLADLQQKLQADLRTELKKVLDDLGKEQPIQLILNSDNVVVWTRTGTDITGEVLNRMNAAEQQKTQR